MPIVPTIYILDTSGQTWLLTADGTPAPQTDAVEPQSSSVTAVFLNDTAQEVTWKLIVEPNPPPTGLNWGDLHWDAQSTFTPSYASQLIINNVNNDLVYIQITDGELISDFYEPSCQPPISYYLSLLTSLYQNAPNLSAWLSTVLEIICEINVCIQSFVPSFDLSTAEGTQLDVIGQILNASRTVGFQPSSGVSPILDDNTYRIYLMAKILQNQWNGQQDSLYAPWQLLFPGGRIVIQDNQNMTATIFLTGAFTSIIQDLITHGYIVPRPEGVLYFYVFGLLPAFGFDTDNSFVAGWDTGFWT